MTTLKRNSTIEEAILIYQQAALDHMSGMLSSDYKFANKSASILTKVKVFLKENNAFLSLERLLTHESIGVRVWAARDLLGVKEEEAIRVLEDVVNSQSGILSFDAEMVLKEWRAGRLKP